jgi:hypothetical protein
MSEKLADLEESLTHAVHVLQGVLDDVKSGKYTKEQAALDAENLMYTEGLDFISALSDYAEEE